MALPDAADRAVRRWLLATVLAVTATIGVGGGTRLTESGLSITEWKPVTGVLPPWGAAGWEEAYQRYLLIPEAQTVHAGITLPQFKALFWWEWAHRLVARLAGLVIAAPFFLLWWRGRIRRPHLPRLALLPALVAAQGGLGWYMVTSGLEVRTSVSPYRLVAHLAMALLILAIALQVAVRLGRTEPPPAGARRIAGPLAALAVVTMLSGGFVAGLDAGRIFNEFPLMGGRVVPLGYWAMDGWRNLFENPIAAQFNHRLLALATALCVWWAWLRAERSWPAGARRGMRVAAAVAVVQVGLGIATLLLAVPVSLGVAHQLGAVALFATLLVVAG